MGLLDQLRGRGKPVGRAGDEQMSQSEVSGEFQSELGEEPEAGTPEHAEWLRKKKEYEQWTRAQPPVEIAGSN